MICPNCYGRGFFDLIIDDYSSGRTTPGSYGERTVRNTCLRCGGKKVIPETSQRLKKQGGVK